MRNFSKQSLILLGVALLLVLFVLGLVISSLFQSSSQTPLTTIPTPTPIPYTRDSQGNFTFTPLQKTTINKTTAKEVEEQEQVINKSLRGKITVYEVPAATPEEKDEIRIQNGVVIFESINTFNKKAGMPPKSSVYEQEFGKPEKILRSVSPLGIHISAYIYATEGFTLFVNHNTNTVYEIHRYTPMTVEEYEKQYAEYLQPAPAYPQEFGDL